MKLRTLDLFAGIGGFALGLERTGGFEVAAFCENNAYAQAVLRSNWPGVPIYDDVQTLTGAQLAGIDVITGGFPCQDISSAGLGAGLSGERSGLWFEFLRLINEVQPRYAIIENVSALRSRGLEVVLGGLASIGYGAEWHCIPAAAVGAPHRRDRVWIVAYPSRLQPGRQEPRALGQRARPGGEQVAGSAQTACGARWWIKGRAAAERGWWAAEPDVGRVADGVPSRVDRLKCLGNAVVPQIPQAIGEMILTRELML